MASSQAIALGSPRPRLALTARPSQLRHGPLTNVGQVERTASLVLGAALVTLGLSRRSMGGVAAALAGGSLLYRGASGHCALYNALGVSTADELEPGASARAKVVIGATTIGRPLEEVAHLWRDPQTLSRIMGHFAEVTPAGEGRMRWTIHAPWGQTFEWETEVTEDRPGDRQLWKSVEGSSIRNEGEVSFRPAQANRGTEVVLRVRFDPPGGVIGAAAAKLLGIVPQRLAEKILHAFKCLAETGEIPTTAHQPAARSDTR